MKKKGMCLLGVLLSGGLAWGQIATVEPIQNQTDILRQEGRLVSVRVTPGEPLKIFVVGREEAKLDLSKMKLVVRRLQPFPEKTLRVEKQGESFMVMEPMKVNTDIEVTTEIKGSSESFRFKVKTKP